MKSEWLRPGHFDKKLKCQCEHSDHEQCPNDATMLTLERRQECERQIVRATIEAAIERGWTLSRVYDGGDTIRVHSVNEAMEHAFTGDDAVIHFEREGGQQRGWLYIVLGNEGYTVISDYSTILDDAVKATDKLVAKWEKECYA